MRNKKVILVTILVAIMASSTAYANEHSQCNESDSSRFYVLDIFKLVWTGGGLTTTEVSIAARGKKVCFTGMATSRRDESNSTIMKFEDGRVSCNQTADSERLEATRLKQTGYKVVGEFTGVSGEEVMLQHCIFEPSK